MSNTNYRPDIQGLRAIAVLAVMVFHFNPDWLPGGFIGVDVFLVISGFLITSILLKTKTQADYDLRKTLKYFYASRFKRIAPAYFVMLVIVALLAAMLFLPQDFNTFKKGLSKAAWFNSNNYFADFGDYFAPASHEQPLLHSWSLAVEIQFYLLAPFMVLLLPIRWLKWIFAGFLIGLTAVAEYRLRLLGNEQATYYSLYARLPEFFAGGLAALYVITTASEVKKSPVWLGTLGLTLIILAAIAQPALGAFPGAAAMLPVAGSVLLLSRSARGWVGKLLGHKILVWIGALSYSLYLWHWPVLAFLRYYTGAEVLNIDFSLLFVALTLMLSIASYYGVEKAFRGTKTVKKQTLSWALLAASVFGASQAMAKVNAAFTPEQLPIEYRRYADPATICHGQIFGECLQGDLTSDKEVLVLGDSHAAMLNHFFDYLGKKHGFKARIITASSCVTIPGFDYQRIAEWAHKACLSQIEIAKKYIENATSIFVAGMWSYHTPHDGFKLAISNFIAESNHKNIFLMPQVPLLEHNPRRLKRFEYIGIDAEYNSYKRDFIHNQYIKDLADGFSNAEFVDIPLSSGEMKESCQDETIYSDKSHLNEIGSYCYGFIAGNVVKKLITR